jgi:hypothetical protein
MLLLVLLRLHVVACVAAPAWSAAASAKALFASAILVTRCSLAEFTGDVRLLLRSL